MSDSNKYDPVLYRSICAPIHKRGTLKEDLSKIFQCNDEQGIEAQQKRFQRGKECIERRVGEMSRHNAITRENREKRKRHFIPLKLTYDFAKDCLQRYASNNDVKAFERETNKYISRLLGYSPSYSIENNGHNKANRSRTLRRNANNSAAISPKKTSRVFNRWTRRNNNTSLPNTRPSRNYNNIIVTLTRR